ncbi:MAG: biotin/lipoyl-binding protein [Nevskiaceae bacterium]|nr:MAG: biotin/lipoyl-binding protein [Nevskiaceae bacterium]
MHHAFKLGDAEHNLELSRSADGYRLHLADRTLPIDLKTGADGRAWLTLDGEHHEVVIATRGDDVFVHFDGEAYQLRYEHPLKRLAAAGLGSAEDRVLAPMPGSIVSVSVKAGDAVTKGQILLVMESMKMETTIAAPRDGVIEAVTYDKGQTFDRDALLLSLVAIEKKK